ncbi:Vacuolar protein-sorting-associated protein 28 [Lobosporangium transversale]|nr:Vacuolar protein-sorting-associated protein 28 [Lobosporangium transversale]
MAFTSTQQYLASVNGSSSPSSSFPSASFGGTSSGSRVVPAINLDEEIRLTTNNRERAQMDNMADLYSIIVVLEHLEMAYIRSAITHTQTASNLLGDIDLEKFMKEYNLDCPAAAKRIKIGVPATVEFGDGGASDEPNGHRTAKYVAETVQSYITVVDLLKLGRTAVDEIHPHLAELMQSLNNVRSLPADFEGRAKVREW